MPFQRFLYPSNPPRSFSGTIAFASYTFLRGKALVWNRMLLSVGLPGSAVVIASHRNLSVSPELHRAGKCRIRSAVRLPLFAVRHCWGEPVGFSGKSFRHPIGQKPPALPRFPSGRLYSHSEGRITFCNDVFPWMLCLSGIAERITSGADPLLSPSEALELAHLPESATLDILSVAGLARAARRPAAAFTCGIINAKSGRCPRKLRLLRPVRASPDGFARVSPL